MCDIAGRLTVREDLHLVDQFLSSDLAIRHVLEALVDVLESTALLNRHDLDVVVLQEPIVASVQISCCSAKLTQ